MKEELTDYIREREFEDESLDSAYLLDTDRPAVLYTVPGD